MLRALVVDDEPPARRRLARLLAELRAPAVTVVAEAGDGEEALAQIAATAPAMVFLDIRMPGLSGLALAQRHQEHGLPPLIFTTAHDEHAVAAFAVHAVDYLLKPISLPRLAQAVARAAARLATPSVALVTTLAQPPPPTPARASPWSSAAPSASSTRALSHASTPPTSTPPSRPRAAST